MTCVGRRPVSGIVLAIFAAAVALPAASVTINLDPAKTKIEFTLGAVAHTVHGTFKLKSGRIEVNPDTKATSGQFTVDASTGETGSESRDNRMRTIVLETDRYPEITFTPTAISGDLSGATITGWFIIHGQRHLLSIPIQAKLNGTNVTASGKFVVPYVAWGMKNPSTFLLRVNQQVDVEVVAVGSIVTNPDPR